jgi:hypothetical protein
MKHNIQPRRLWLLACSVACTMSMQHAMAMDVDDAQPLEDGKCQLESWLRFNHGGTQRTLSPACNILPGLEMGVSGTLEKDERGMFLSEGQLQGKYLIKPMDDAGYGVALMAGATRHTALDERDRSWSYFAKVPVSFAFRDGNVLLHTNWGVVRDQDEKTTRLTWGFGNESKITERVSFIGEVFGENKGKPLFQAGIRTALIPDKVEVDLTYGNKTNFAREERFVLLGLRLISPSWF